MYMPLHIDTRFVLLYMQVYSGGCVLLLIFGLFEMNILIVEDDPDVRSMLTRTLGCGGYAVDSAADGSEALDKFRDNRFNLVITDVRLPQMNGLQLLGEIKQAEPHVPVIVITGYGSVQNAVEAMQGGASDYLLKPFSNEALQAAISRAGIVSITFAVAMKMTSLRSSSVSR